MVNRNDRIWRYLLALTIHDCEIDLARGMSQVLSGHGKRQLSSRLVPIPSNFIGPAVRPSIATNDNAKCAHLAQRTRPSDSHDEDPRSIRNWNIRRKVHRNVIVVQGIRRRVLPRRCRDLWFRNFERRGSQ